MDVTKRIWCIVLGSFMCGQLCAATPERGLLNSTDKATSDFKMLGPDFFYRYFDFDYNSTKRTNFMRFQGHSNLWGMSQNTLVLKHGLYFAGLGVYHVETNFDSQTLLNPAPQFNASQSIDNNTIYAHIGRSLNPALLVDVSGGYGHNKINSTYTIDPNAIGEVLGYSNSNSDNWFASIMAFMQYPFQKFYMDANVGLLYSQVNADRYVIHYTTSGGSNFVQPLTNKTTWVMENIALTYRDNPIIKPYVTAGLFQVLDSPNSRSIIATPVNGSLPQLNINKSGYKVGGGVRLQHKQFVVNVGYQYYNSANTYTSDQVKVTLSHTMN